MKRAADDAAEARAPETNAVPHQPTGGRGPADRGGAALACGGSANRGGDPSGAGGAGAGAPDAVDDFADGDLPEEPNLEQTNPAPTDAVGLAERQARILEFERLWWRHAGSKEQAIRDTFGLSPTRYYQLLNALLDDPAALAADPTTVQRLRRMRATRTRSRRASS
ncbi:MAG TPA: DUF3263 domain-containing protein [Micromonosporaceae bacterium]|nr:DUF3263 domain-containing protein [Micromonosporaceae bacterium]